MRLMYSLDEHLNNVKELFVSIWWANFYFSLVQAAGSFSLHGNAYETEYMSYKEKRRHLHSK